MAVNGFLQNGFMKVLQNFNKVLQMVIQSFESLWKIPTRPKNLKHRGLQTKIVKTYT